MNGRSVARVPAGWVFTALLLTSLVPRAAAADTTLGAATPEQLVERLRAAGASGDVVEASRCLAPEARTELTQGLLMGATMMVAFSQMGAELGGAMGDAFSEEMSPEDKAAAAEKLEAARAEGAKMQESFEALLTRHGLEMPADDAGPESEGTLVKQLAGIDQPALLADLLAFLEANSDEGGGSGPRPVELPTLADLVIDGDRATGKLAGHDVEMVRLEGRWFFNSTEAMQPPRDADTVTD